MRMRFASLLVVPLLGVAQEPGPLERSAEPAKGFSKVDEVETNAAGQRVYRIEKGSLIPLGLLNSISTKGAMEGDRVYLESIFPVLVSGKVVVPPGSYVAGTVTQVKQPGRVKGRAELYIRFDSLTLPNGVTRDFRARLGGLESTSDEKLDREEGKIEGESGKGKDARVIGEAAIGGTTIGAIAGSTAGRAGMGAGIGAASGAAAGLIGVLASRGPHATLEKGTTMEMVLDRPLTYTEEELDFANSMQRSRRQAAGPQSAPQSGRSTVPVVGRIP